jgi:hypothetical protein
MTRISEHFKAKDEIHIELVSYHSGKSWIFRGILEEFVPAGKSLTEEQMALYFPEPSPLTQNLSKIISEIGSNAH